MTGPELVDAFQAHVEAVKGNARQPSQLLPSERWIVEHAEAIVALMVAGCFAHRSANR